jgi:hypothetical protein
METHDVDGHALEQQRCSFGNRVVAARGQLIEEFLMAIDGPRGPGSPEMVVEERVLANCLIVSLGWGWLHLLKKN